MDASAAVEMSHADVPMSATLEPMVIEPISDGERNAMPVAFEEGEQAGEDGLVIGDW